MTETQRLIDVGSLEKELHTVTNKADWYRQSTFDEIIARQSIVDAEPVRHRMWVSVAGKRARVCDGCGGDEPYKFAEDDAEVYDYCPHCGAKMDARKFYGIATQGGSANGEIH